MSFFKVIRMLSLLILLVPSVPIGVSDNEFQSISENNVNQLHLTAAELYEDSLSILELRAGNSLDLPSYSSEPNLIYSSTVGLSGIAYNLLLASDIDTEWVGEDINLRLILLAEDIGNHIIDKAVVNNGTHSIWSVHNQTDQVDLSLEFGLTGIARLFVKLYEKTGNTTYSDIATKTLQTIIDLANGTLSDLYFDFDISLIYDNYWYPYYNFVFYENFLEIFTGMSYGSAGIAQVAMEYLRDVPLANTNLGTELLNRTLHWIWSQRVENGTELSFQTNKDNSSLISTSYATGNAGIGQLYLDMYDFSSNTTYLDNAWRIGQWFNGTISDESKNFVSWVKNNESLPDIELGRHSGIAGISAFLNRLKDRWTDQNESLALESFLLTGASGLRSYGREDQNQIEFGERLRSNSIENYGSTSLAFGGGGMFKVINDIQNKYNVSEILTNEDNQSIANIETISNLQEVAAKAKNYLLSFIKEENSKFAIMHRITSEIETNSMFGISSTLLFLSSFTSGYIEIDTLSLNYGQTNVGKNSVKSIVLSNEGEQMIDVSLVVSNEVFSFPTNSISVVSGQNYIVNVTFTPTAEKVYTGTLNITAGKDTFYVNLSGEAFDLPVVSAPDLINNSIITSHVTQEMKVSASDSSGIDKVNMIVRNENETVITSTQMVLNDGFYTALWDINGYQNGTYIIDFVATDTLTKTNSLRYVFEIGVYTSSAEDIIFSQNTLYGIIGGLAVLFVAAIIFTKRIKS